MGTVHRHLVPNVTGHRKLSAFYRFQKTKTKKKHTISYDFKAVFLMGTKKM